MSLLDDALAQSASRGRWSFATPAGPTGVAFTANSMLYAELPSWAARCWTVNLCGFEYQSGTIANSAIPTANNVNTQIFQASIQWGVDGALETAIVDYPWTGCTFCVTAATVRVDLLSTTILQANQPQPLLRGFLAPVRRSTGRTIVSPTLTLFPTGVLALSNVKFAIPTRAAAYRIAVQGATTPPQGTLGLDQEDAFGNVYQLDGQYPPLAVPVSDQMSNRAGYNPIHPQATVVRVQNSSSTTPFVVVLSFLLDLG